MKKIAYVVSDISTGGIPRVIETLTNELDSKEVEHTVIALQNKKCQYEINGDIIYLENVGSGLLNKAFVLLKRWWKLKEIIKNRDFDTVISFGETSNFLNVLIRKNGKTVLSERNMPSIELNYNSFHDIKGKVRARIFKWLIKNTYNKADAIIPVSKMIAYDLRDDFGVNDALLHPIYNGVNLRNIDRKAIESLSSEEESIINEYSLINIGAISKQKGQWHLLRIMPLILEKFPKAKLIILGEGDYRARLEHMIESLGLRENVYLLGRKKNPYKYMKKADIFVFSSIYEGCPNALMEAMTLGMAIVSVDCISGPRELLAPNSLVTNSANEMEFVNYGVLTPRYEDEWMDEKQPLTKAELEMAKAIMMLWEKNLVKSYKERAICSRDIFSSNVMIEKYSKILLS